MAVKELFPELRYPKDSEFPDLVKPVKRVSGRQGYIDEPDNTTPLCRVTVAKARELAQAIWGIPFVDFGD